MYFVCTSSKNYAPEFCRFRKKEECQVCSAQGQITGVRTEEQEGVRQFKSHTDLFKEEQELFQG
jgi:hypothetical protein